MPILALSKYYDDLFARDEIPPYCYELKGMGYAIVLNPDGTACDFICLRQRLQDGKRESSEAFIPQRMAVPRSTGRTSNVAPYFLWDSSSYILHGRDKKHWAAAKKMYEDYKTLNYGAQEELSEIIKYYSMEHPEIDAILEQDEKMKKDVDASNITFILSDGTYALDNESLKHVWDRVVEERDKQMIGDCSYTLQKNVPLTRVHNSIMNVKGGRATGTSTVSFILKSAGTTRGHIAADQGLNCPIGVETEFKYVSALNFLLSSPLHHTMWGTTNVVYWADCDDRQKDIIDAMDGDTQALNNLMKAVTAGKQTPEIDPSSRFHIIGLVPNGARTAFGFCQESPLEEFLRNIQAHYSAMDVCRPSYDDKPTVTPYRLLNCVANPSVKNDTMLPTEVVAIWKAITEGSNYPHYLYEKALTRNMNERRVTRERAAIIKATLTRNYGRKDLSMYLDENNDSKAYKLGRIYALLEKLQKDANNHTTIVENSFPTACTTPSMCFPKLMLANQLAYYAQKSEYGKWLLRKIESIVASFDANTPAYPARFTQEETGLFQLGYYQQKVDLYTKKTNSSNNNDDTTEKESEVE